MKKQTAVDQLRERLFKEFGFGYSDNIHDELKAIEKEQIIYSYREGRTDQHSGIKKWYNRSALGFYNETFEL